MRIQSDLPVSFIESVILEVVDSDERWLLSVRECCRFD